jgi:assimilatory nitrate reductase catalytic subunit
VRVRGTAGAIVVRAHLSVDQRPGSIFVPMHWNDQFSARARVGALIPAVVDPVSGQPEAKHAPVSIAPVAAAWYGCVLLRRPAGHMAAPTSPRAALPQDGGRLLPFRLDSAEGSGAQVYPQGRAAGGCEDAAHRCAPLPPQASAGVCYWARIPGQHAWRFELAGSARPDSWSVWARELLGSLLPTAPGGFGTAVDAHEPGQVAGQGSEAAAPYAAVGGLPSRLEWLEYLDTAGGRYRAGCLEDGHLIAYVLIAPGPELPARSWFEGLFAERPLTSQERTGLLAGRPTAAARDGGAVVCACFNVGEIALEEAVRNGLDSVDAIGRALKAGTHCGSCIPELRRLLDAGKPASSHTPGAPGGSAPYPGGSLPVASARSPNSR